jgi:Zn-dependent protease with chaperone function
LTVAQGVAERFGKGVPWLAEGVSLVMLAVVLATLPWMITRIWTTESMAGELRARLDGIAARFKVRFVDIRIWRTYFMIPNAAVVGNMRMARYFVMTDALLESLTDEQLESVFAHEVGHAYHRHVWWYLLAMFGGSTAALGLMMFAGWGLTALPTWTHGYQTEAKGLLQLGLLAAYLKWGFGALSWQCEHQADWFAVKCVAEKCVPVAEPAPAEGAVAEGATATALAVKEQPIGLAGGAEVFSDALYQLVRMSNRSVDRGNWLHPSPARRRTLLQELARDPAKVAAFDRKMWWMRAWVVALLVVAGAGTTVAIVVVPG